MTNAYHKGIIAAQKHHRPTGGPYGKNTEHWREWLRGYLSACTSEEAAMVRRWYGPRTSQETKEPTDV